MSASTRSFIDYAPAAAVPYMPRVEFRNCGACRAPAPSGSRTGWKTRAISRPVSSPPRGAARHG